MCVLHQPPLLTASSIRYALATLEGRATAALLFSAATETAWRVLHSHAVIRVFSEVLVCICLGERISLLSLFLFLLHSGRRRGGRIRGDGLQQLFTSFINLLLLDQLVSTIYICHDIQEVQYEKRNTAAQLHQSIGLNNQFPSNNK